MAAQGFRLRVWASDLRAWHLRLLRVYSSALHWQLHSLLFAALVSRPSGCHRSECRARASCTPDTLHEVADDGEPVGHGLQTC